MLPTLELLTAGQHMKKPSPASPQGTPSFSQATWRFVNPSDSSTLPGFWGGKPTWFSGVSLLNIITSNDLPGTRKPQLNYKCLPSLPRANGFEASKTAPTPTHFKTESTKNHRSAPQQPTQMSERCDFRISALALPVGPAHGAFHLAFQGA